MRKSTRGSWQQLEQARAAREQLQLRADERGAEVASRSYRIWQRTVSALVAATLFVGPITVTVEQGRAAAGVLAAGSRRLDDQAWRVIQDLASLRVRFAMQTAQAGAIVDPTAPLSFQPKITQSTGAGGGVPVINITAPNSAGISLNQYQSFNVDPVGLILNNSLQGGTTLTGGNVAANPNLSGRTAGVIVNQVTSTGSAFASVLNGPLEVFGAPATVIIANPNGIAVRGAGFTNTIGVTLTTGTPRFLSSIGGSPTDFTNAQAVAYDVKGGHIQIEGNAGTNGPGSGIEGTVGTIDLIGETVGINAPLYAGTRINVIAGDQVVSPSASDATGTTYATQANSSANTLASIGNATQGYAIDATSFGAMTAGQISVVGTAQGMGVRTDGALAANAGNLTLSSNGDLTVGNHAAQQSVTITSAGNAALSGTGLGIGGYTLSAGGDVTSTGTVQSQSNLALTAGGNINVANAQSAGDLAMVGGASITAGDLQSGGGLSLTTQGTGGTGDITLNGTSIVAGATTLQAARDINVNGQTASNTVQASAQRDVNLNAALQASSDIALTAKSGSVTSNANINGAGNLIISAGQAIAINAQSTAQDAVTLTVGGAVAIGGSLASGTTLNANASGAFVVAGSLLIGTDASISASSIDVPGVFIAQGNGALNAQSNVTGAGSIAFGQSGSLISGQDISVAGKILSNALQITAGNSVALSGIQAGDAFSVVANGNAGGGDVTFNGPAAAVGATSVQAARDVIVNGTLAGGAQVNVTGQRNVTIANSGTVQSVGDLTVAATTADVQSAGTINSGGKLAATAGQDVSLSGATTVTGDTSLTAGRNLVNGGTLAGQGGAVLGAGQDVTLGGTSGFSRDVTVNASHDTTVSGSLQGDNVTLHAANSAVLNNVQANSALSVIADGKSGGGDVAINGSVTSRTSTTLSAAASASVAGTLASSAGLSITSAMDTSIAGTVQSNGSMTLTSTSGSLSNTGVVESGTDLAMNAAKSIDLGTNTTSALGNMSASAGQNLVANGTVVAQGTGTLNAGGAISGAAAWAFGLDASVTSLGDTDLTGSLRGATIRTSAGGNSTLHDVQAGSTIALGAAGNLNLTGALAGGATTALTAGNGLNVSGSLQSAGDATLTAIGGTIGLTGSLNSNGNLSALAGGDVNFGGATTVALDTTLQSGRDVNVTGALNGLGNGTIVSGRNIGGAGTLGFGQAARLNAGADIVQGGLIQGQTVVASAGGNATVNNVESASNVSLSAGNSAIGNLTVNGVVGAAGSVTATATGGMTVGSAGKVAAGTTAALEAWGDIGVAGAIESNGNMAITSQFGSVNATGGINSGGTLGIAAGLDVVLGTSTTSLSDMVLAAGRNAVLNGTLVGQGSGRVTAGHDITGPGTQAFSAAAELDAQHDILLTGALQANSVQASGGDDAALHDVTSATALSLTAYGNAGDGDASIAGTATASGTVLVTAERDAIVSGALGSGSSLTLTASRNVNLTGSTQSVGDLTITATNGSASLEGTTTTSGALKLASGLDTTLGGQTSATGAVDVAAGNNIQLTGSLAGQSTGGMTAGNNISGSGAAAFAQAATLVAGNDVALAGSLQGATVAVTGLNNVGLGVVQSTLGDLGVSALGLAGEGDVTFGGAVTSMGALTLDAARDTAVAGAANAIGTATITAARNVTTGDVTSGGTLSMAAANGGLSTGNLKTDANFAGFAGGSASTGALSAGGAEALTAQGLDGTGDITVHGAMASGLATTITAARDAMFGSTVTTGDALTVSAGRNLSANGNISTNADTNLTAKSGSLGVAGSVITIGNFNASAGGSLALAGGLVNGKTTLASGAAMTLASDLFGLGAATIAAGGAIGGGGSLTVGGDIALTSGAGVTLGGIQGAGKLTATSVGDMSLGATTAVGSVTANSTAGSVAFNGQLQSAGDVQLTAANSATVTGGVSSVGNVTIAGTTGNVNVAGVSANGDATLTAGKTLTLSGTSVVAGAVSLSGGNVTLSGSQSGSKSIAVTAQGTLDASQSSIVSSQDLQVSGTNVTLGNAIVGGALNAQASNQLSVVGTAVDVVGGASLVSQNGLYNASNVLAGGGLTVSAPNVTNAAHASLASTGATTISATNFTNAGLVNGSRTSVNVVGTLNNSGGSLMGVNALTINAGVLDNQSGLVFAGDPNSATGATGDLSITVNGGNGAFNNAGGNMLAQRNLTIGASNMAFDPSLGTISQGGQLSITAGSINVSGTWNYGGQSVWVDGLSGITNNGTMTGVAPLTISTNGTFTNNGQVIGQDVTFNGALDNVANAVMHTGDAMVLNGAVTNRGTIESAGNVTFNGGGNFDNQYGTTQANGNVSLSTGATVYNTAGSITAAGNVNITAGAVVNDALQTGSQTQTQLVGASADPDLVTKIVIGTLTSAGCSGSTHGDCIYYTATNNATINSLEPNLASNGIQVEIGAYNPCFGESDCQNIEVGNTNGGGQTQTIALPGIDRTTTTPGSLSPGVIAAGNTVNITTGLLSNAGSTISAGLDVNLNVQSLNNAPIGNATTTAVDVVDQAQLNAFMAQLDALGTIGIYGTAYSGISGAPIPESFVTVSHSVPAAPSATSTITSFGAQGQIIAGRNMTLSGGNLVNGGLLYAGNNFSANAAASFQNQGQYNTTSTTQPGCAQGVSGTECAIGNGFRGGNPNSSSFSYAQQGATVYAGNDLVIAAGQVGNTYGNLIAGHNIVIGGVGTTATSTTPAQGLTNTSGNIIAGNNVTLNVTGAVTNTLPPPVTLHQNYGSDEAYSGCMTAGGYKESYCEGYVDQQSGNSSVISAGNSLQINAGSLTNIGSLISAGTSATINVAGPVVNEAQTLNAYWHSHWVQETGDFSPDKRHDVWACGSVADCTALYGSAYTSVGGSIDPPQPVGNIAATIQAPSLSISSSGEIQNVGNVVGTSVQLTGRNLINGITSANTYTPRVNGPSQIISLSGVNLPGLKLSALGISSGGTSRSTSGSAAGAASGQPTYLEGTLGAAILGPQQLLGQLPANLQPSSKTFYYDPAAEDLMLQQAALQQTGEASFIGGLNFDTTTGLSVTDQEKAILYQNSLDYAKQHDLQLGVALSPTQVDALTKPMLWYVEQAVPDPSCLSTGPVSCPTVTALMPQVYLPQNWGALSADGNIVGQNVTLNFNQNGNGSVLNTGDIAASGTLTVNTNTLTNRANQVDVGHIWQYLQATGYEDTTGTEVQPGGFMSAANMNLNVDTLNQIGGALQILNGDGTINQAGTQQLAAVLQQQLGANFTQTSLSDNLHTSFTAEGGFGFSDIVVIAFEVVISIMTAGAASAEIGATLGAQGGTFAAASASAGTSAGLGNVVLSAAISGFTTSAVSQLAATGSLNIGSAFEAAGIAAITAGLTNGITYNASSGLGFTTQPLAAGGPTSSLAMLSGVQSVGGAIVPQAGSAAAANLPEEMLALGANAAISAGVQTTIGGGSFLRNLEHDAAGDLAAAGAYAIGNALPNLRADLGDVGGEAAYIGLHGALGCAESAAEGTGCAGGAIGGAASAALSPDLLKAIDPTGAALSPGQQAAMEGFATLLGGGLAGLAGANAQGGANAALNEVVNNTDDHPETAAKNGGVLGTLAGAFSDLVNANNAAKSWVQGQVNQLIGLIQSGAQQKMSESPSDLVAQGAANGITAVSGAGGGLPPGAGLDPVLASPGAGQAPSSVTGTPSNATLASGNSGDTGSGVTGTGSDDVNLASPDRTNHILNGDATGGGHLWPGGPGKSAFPADWSASQIMNTVSDIATDPTIPETVQSNGRIVKDGTSNGVNIRVVIEPPSKGGGIVTAFPTNLPRNPK